MISHCQIGESIQFLFSLVSVTNDDLASVINFAESSLEVVGKIFPTKKVSEELNILLGEFSL
jgi:hypothetical protein